MKSYKWPRKILLSAPTEIDPKLWQFALDYGIYLYDVIEKERCFVPRSWYEWPHIVKEFRKYTFKYRRWVLK